MESLAEIQLNLNYMWVLMSAALVFSMQGGFMCLEAGLATAKNSINVAIKNLGDFVVASILFWAFGFGIMFALYQLGVLFVRAAGRVRGQELNTVALGFGDVRLAGFVGLVVGFPNILYALILAVTFGGLAGLVYWFVRAVVLRRYSLFTPIPYGPYLVAGGMIMMLYGPDVIRWWSGG